MIPPRRAPFEEEVYIQADFESIDAKVFVRFLVKSPEHNFSYTGGIAVYNGKTWHGHVMMNNKNPLVMELNPMTMVLDSIMLEIWHEGWKEHESRARIEADPFWKEFIADVEEAWPIFVTMEQ